MKGKKTGGRQKGTLNKTTTVNKQIITDLLLSYSSSGLMDKDFMQLEPKDRMAVAEKLMQYVLPKMQATAVDLSTSQQHQSLETMLSDLSQV